MADKPSLGKQAGALILASILLGVSALTTALLLKEYRKEAKLEKDFKVSTTQSTDPSQTETPPVDDANKLEGKPMAGFAALGDARIPELKVEDTVPGTGAEVTATSKFTAHYTGAVAKTGVVFQSSKDTGSPFTSTLDGVIQGWKEGMVGMKAGGTRRLTIPAAKAYGEAGSGNIPADADLVFDIELVSVE